MHITLEADYAIRIVDSLARHPERMGAQLIAEKTGVTLRFSLKILRKLVSTGIVRSFKGAQGGYEIGRPLEEISIRDIIETIEGPYLLNRCLKDGHVCSLNGSSRCAYHYLFHHISSQVSTQLGRVTLDKVVNKELELAALYSADAV